MNLDATQIKAVIEQAKKAYYDASKEAEYTYGDPFAYERMEDDVRTMYEMLTLAADAMGLERVIENLRLTFQRAEKTGLQTIAHYEGEPYSAAGSVLYPILTAMLAIYGEQPIDPKEKELENILRSTAYYINDPKAFAARPKEESDVHDRIEGVLKCIYNDVDRKPSQPKKVKTFIPDTGLPSLGTLIEYKYLDDPAKIQAMADEVLADISGYFDPKWPRLLFVIYEIGPILRQTDWQNMIKACGATERADVIVLTGATPNELMTTKRGRPPTVPAPGTSPTSTAPKVP